MTGQLPPGYNSDNLAAFRALLDTNMLDAGGKWGERVRLLCRERWVQGHVSDMVVAEIRLAKDGGTVDRLREQVGLHIISMGVARADHSLADLSLAAGPDDEERFNQVYAALWPNHDWKVDGGDAGTGTGRRRFRDAMHVDTALRNGFDAFVTDDGRIVHRAPQLRAAFPDRTQLMSARHAALEVANRVQRMRELFRRRNITYPLPEQPTAAVIVAWQAEA